MYFLVIFSGTNKMATNFISESVDNRYLVFTAIILIQNEATKFCFDVNSNLPMHVQKGAPRKLISRQQVVGNY